VSNVLQTQVVVIGAYGSGNLGDDVLLEIVLDVVARHVDPKDVTVLCKPSEYLQQASLGVNLVSKAAAYHIDAQVCLYGGGTQFFQFKNQRSWRGRIEIVLRQPQYIVKRLLRLIRQECNAAATAMIGIGLGPFETDVGITNRLDSMFMHCDLCYVRDEWSRAFCEEKNYPNVYLGADLAFTSTFQRRLREDAGGAGNLAGNVAFIVRDWPYAPRGENYLEQVFCAAKQLSAEGQTLDFVLFSKDPKFDRARFSKFGRVIQWNPSLQSSTAFISSLSTYQTIVSARFHGAVFGYLLHRPIIGICIDPKIELFFKSIGLDSLCWRPPYDVEVLLDLITRSSELFSARHPDALSTQTKRADQMMARCSDFLANKLNAVR